MKKYIALLLTLILVNCNSSSDAPLAGTTGGNKGGVGTGTGDGLVTGPGSGFISDSDIQSGNVDKDLELVTHLSKNIVSPRVESFNNNTTKLTALISQACTTETVQMTDLREAWKSSMMDYHYLEALAFGPLEENNFELSKNIYSWPVPAAAVVDAQIRRMNNNPDSYKFRPTRLAGKGLDAYEHILYTRLADVEELSSASEVCPYFLLINEDLELRNQQFKVDWQAELDYLASPDGLTSLVPYISDMTKSLFFADTVMRDRKVAPAFEVQVSGQKICDREAGEDCSLYLEHQGSKLAKEAVEMNLLALSHALSGYSEKYDQIGFGFSSYLKVDNVDESVVSFGTNMNDRVEIWSQLPGGQEFFTKVTNNDASDCSQGSLCFNYNKLREITTWLKVDFDNSLNVELPGNVTGDND